MSLDTLNPKQFELVPQKKGTDFRVSSLDTKKNNSNFTREVLELAA
jgi:hypothetical protein